MYNLQNFRLGNTAGKRGAMVFSADAGLTETDWFLMNCIVELLHQLLPCNPLQILFTKMTKSSVPQPLFAILVCHVHNLRIFDSVQGDRDSLLVCQKR